MKMLLVDVFSTAVKGTARAGKSIGLPSLFLRGVMGKKHIMQGFSLQAKLPAGVKCNFLHRSFPPTGAEKLSVISAILPVPDTSMYNA